MTNKKSGNDFESELCERLSRNNMWVHNFANRSYGQPVDVIAIDNRCISHLIECKVISGKRGFDKSRIEDNQHLTQDRFNEVTGNNVWFAFKLVDEIVFLDYQTVVGYVGATIPQEYIFAHGYKFDEWIWFMRKCYE